MARWQPIPLIGGSYSDDARPFSSQLTVNWLPVRAERPGGRSETMLRTPPGLSSFTTAGLGPIRGIRNVEGKLFVVSGNTLYRVGHQVTPESLGTIAGTRRVSMAHNQRDGGNELLIVNGESGYIYNTATSVFAKITDDGYPGASVARFIGQYFVQIEPQRRFWFHSALADGTDYNTLDRYEAESSPDRLQTLEVNQGQLLVFGERTIEVWENQPIQAIEGGYTTAFQRSTVIERGCASAHASAVMDNTVFFVGNDGSVYRIDGYTPVRISTSAEEQELAKHTLADVFTYVWEDRGHKVFYVTCPTGRTMGFDVFSQEWSDRRSYGRDRWRTNALALWDGDWIAGSYQNGQLYTLDWDCYTDGGEEMESSRRTGVSHADENRLHFNALAVVIDTGIAPADVPPLTLTGDLPNGNFRSVVSYQYIAAGGQSPYLLNLPTGALPGGLSMGSNGLVTGTMSTVGTFTWTVRAIDAGLRNITISDTCIVAPAVWDYTWTGRTANTMNAEAITWSPALSLFVSVGYYNSAPYSSVQTSPDGITWTDRLTTIGVGFNSGDVIWAASRSEFLAVGASGVWTSPTGVTWTQRNAAITNIRSVAWSPTLALYAGYRAVGGANTMLTSPDGVTWTTRTLPPGTMSNSGKNSTLWIAELAVFVTCCRGGSASTSQIWTSADGITWTARTHISCTVNQLVWSPALSRMVAFISDQAGGIASYMTSPDGVTWTSYSGAVFGFNVYNAQLAPELALFAVVGSSGNYATSPDGTTWTARTMSAGTGTRSYSGLAWSPSLGRFAACNDSEASTPRYDTSTSPY